MTWQKYGSGLPTPVSALGQLNATPTYTAAFEATANTKVARVPEHFRDSVRNACRYLTKGWVFFDLDRIQESGIEPYFLHLRVFLY
jgi:hypothetical protein